MSNQLTISQYLDSKAIRRKFTEVIPAHLHYDRIKQLAITEIRKNPKLLQCSPSTLLACIFTASSIGLEVGEQMGKAYLVPFKDRCTLIIGYKGYIELLARTGLIKNITPFIIYDNEDYEIQEGANPVFLHKPKLTNRGNPICYYIRVMFNDGTVHIEHMSMDDILEIKKSSKNNNVWNTHFNEMAKKTVIRRFVKYFPLFSENSNIIKESATIDEMGEAGIQESVLKDMGDIDYSDEYVEENEKEEIEQ